MRQHAIIAQIIGCVLAFSVAVVAQRNRISLLNNEYSGILVAIHESIPEDAYLIERIQEVFSSASSYLYEASEKRVYFKDVTILIPRTWSDSLADEAATYEKFCIANVVVDQPNPEYGDNPYVKQIQPCGQPGEYMHLTSQWLTDVAYSEYYWGESGKVVVHEWGHLRWGLFDEYAIDDNEHFYFDEIGRVEPTRCSADISGQSYDIYKNYRRCNTDPESGVMPGTGCRFFPDLYGNDGTSSFLYANYLDSVVHFCHSDPEKDQLSKHNRIATNRQNKLCEHRSSWDVMLTTPDFLNGNNSAREVGSTVPSFRVVQDVDERIVLVLDVSGSMEQNNRFNLMIQASTKYLRYTVPNNTYVGIVEFSTSAYKLSSLVFIDGPAARELLVSSLPTVAVGATCIGCGLQKGIEVLEAGPGLTASGGILFLISDGEENQIPNIADVKDELISKGVIVDTLAFSEAADDQLTKLSEDTNGLSFYYSESSESTALHDAFAATVTTRTCGDNIAAVQLVSYKANVTANGEITGQVPIDSSIGKNTAFFFFWQTSEVDVQLTSPSGLVISKGMEGYIVDNFTNTVVVEVPGQAEIGTWSYIVNNSDAVHQIIEVSVESKPSDESASPIRLTSTLSGYTITQSPPTAIVYAELSRGFVPVTGATVFAVVDRPEPQTNPPVELQLFDNGVGADITKDDGVYSAYFVDFIEATCPTSCRYSVQVTASDQDGNAVVSANGRMGALPKDLSIIPEPGEPSPVGDFSRIASGGVIQVADGVTYVQPGTDLLPPARINDLSVLSTSYDDQTIVLQWTATGNDMDQGTADHYDMRIASNFSSLVDDFLSATPIEEEYVLVGNLTSPLPSGSLEMLTIAMPSRGAGSSFYFALRAVDAAGNEGAVSNIAQSTLVVQPQPEQGLEAWEIALIAVGCFTGVALVVAVSAALVVSCKKGKRKNKIVDIDGEKQTEEYVNEVVQEI
ncbi:calcium-activated chloride channel regulator 1-like [Ptychodera flava]|uniref:calcium-activated chloride channel regulator 1-like n=1 Tax=Ptychodera flava TaxID=63121 RepID=UPI00396A4CA5